MERTDLKQKERGRKKKQCTENRISEDNYRYEAAFCNSL